jgi:hypothetical protein
MLVKFIMTPNVECISPVEYIKKTRYVDKDFNRKLFDVYSAQRMNIPHNRRGYFRKHLADVTMDADVAIVMDFGHGLMEEEERDILKGVNFLAVNAQSNSGNYGYNLVTKYNNVHYICIDNPEARLATRMQYEPIHEVLHRIMVDANCDNMIVTHGKFGSEWSSRIRTGSAPAFAAGGTAPLQVSARLDSGEPVRLWPEAEADVFSGSFAAGLAGVQRITVSAGADGTEGTTGSAVMAVDPTARRAERLVPLSLLATSRGGIDVTPDRLADLEAYLRREVSAPPVRTTAHPMRSGWWIVPFAACLSAEWWLRRRKGLR